MLEIAYRNIRKNRSDIAVFEFRTFDNKTKTIVKHHDEIAKGVTTSTIDPKSISVNIFNSFKNCP